jgi:hypothetical protein
VSPDLLSVVDKGKYTYVSNWQSVLNKLKNANEFYRFMHLAELLRGSKLYPLGEVVADINTKKY